MLGKYSIFIGIAILLILNSCVHTTAGHNKVNKTASDNYVVSTNRVVCNKSRRCDSHAGSVQGTTDRDAKNTRKMKIDEIPSIPKLASGEIQPLALEESKTEFARAGHEWLYGHGIGRTMLNVAGVVVFPPYLLYLLGNAGLELAGVGAVSPSDVLDDKPREHVEQFYGEVTSVPGRIAAGVAGVKFDG